MLTTIHAPAHESGRSLCGRDYSNTNFGKEVSCPVCLEELLDQCQEMAEIERFTFDYYDNNNGSEMALDIAAQNFAAHAENACSLTARLAQHQMALAA